MIIAFILISIVPTKERKVYNKLLKVGEVVELYLIFGEYDLIAKVEAEDFNKLGEIVVGKIRTVEGIVDTKTIVGMKF